jgi:hypothetical protein
MASDGPAPENWWLNATQGVRFEALMDAEIGSIARLSDGCLLIKRDEKTMRYGGIWLRISHCNHHWPSYGNLDLAKCKIVSLTPYKEGN